jgi:hypothetical protein
MFATIFFTANGLLAAACLIGRYWTDIQMDSHRRGKGKPVLDADDRRNSRSNDIQRVPVGPWEGQSINPTTGHPMFGPIDTAGNTYGSGP